MSTVEVFIASWSGTAKYLPRCIESLNAQTRPADVLKADETERRAMHKWNERIEATTCDYLALPHADDEYMPDFLKEMCGYLDSHPASVAVFCMDYLIDADGKRTGQTEFKLKPQESYDYRDILEATVRHGNILRCETVVLRASAVRQLRYKDVCGTANDTAFWFDVLDAGPVGVLDKRLVCYRNHPESDTQKNVINTPNVWNSLAAMDYAAKKRPDCVAWWVRAALGRAAKMRDEELEALRLKHREKNGKRVRLCVVHEKPYNAGTGVLVADRVKRFNRDDTDWMTYYVFPDKEKAGVLVHRDTPCIVIQPDKFDFVVERFKPQAIEYHHHLRWPVSILDAPAPYKEFWLHDQTLWCAAFHMTTPKGEQCPDMSGASCMEACGEEARVPPTDALRSMDRLVANSQYMALLGMARLGRSVEINEFTVPALPPPFKGKRVGYFGNFLGVKGVEVLLRVAHEMPDVQFLFFSDPPDGSESFFEGRRLLGYKNVLFLGRYERPEMSQLSNLVDCCVVPSLNESFGLVKRELQMLGVPVVASRCGGLDGDVAPGDPKELEEAIRRALA